MASFFENLDCNCDYILGNCGVLKLLNLAPEAVQRNEKMYLQMILLIDGDFLNDSGKNHFLLIVVRRIENLRPVADAAILKNELLELLLRILCGYSQFFQICLCLRNGFRSLNAPCDGVMISHDLSGVEPFSLRRLRD